MVKTFIYTRENSEIVISGKTLKTGDSITLKDKDIAQAEECAYLQEKKDGDATNT